MRTLAQYISAESLKQHSILWWPADESSACLKAVLMKHLNASSSWTPLPVSIQTNLQSEAFSTFFVLGICDLQVVEVH